MTVISSTVVPTSQSAAAANAAEVPPPSAGEAAADSGAGAAAASPPSGTAIDSTSAGPASPTTPPPDPDAEIARRFEAAKRQEIAARSSERKAKEREAALIAREKAADARLAELEAALEDPIEWALKKGRDPEKLVARFLPETPEAKRLRALEQSIEADRKAAKEQADKAAEAQKHRATHEADMRFASSITESTHPHIVLLYEPNEAVTERRRVLREHGPAFEEANGRPPTDAEVATYIEDQAKRRIEKLRGAQPAPVAAEAAAAASKVNEQASNGSGHQATNGPGTLTNNHAAQTTAGRTVIKTREDLKRELVERLEAEARAR